MEIDSSVRNIARVQRVLGELLAGHGVSAARREELELAVGEAVANAIVHGNGSQPRRRVRVDMVLDGGELTVDVADDGDGFDAAGVPDPRAPERLLKPGGRGLLLMSRAVDDVRCLPRVGGGSLVRLRSRLDARLG